MAFWYSRPFSRAPLTVQPLRSTGTGAAKGQWYYRMYSGYAHAKSWRWSWVRGLRPPSTALGGPLPFPRGQDHAAVGCTRCPWTRSNALSMPTSYCDGEAANRAAQGLVWSTTDPATRRWTQ